MAPSPSLTAFLGPDGEVISTSSVAIDALDLGAESFGEPVDVVLPPVEPGEGPVPARLLVLPVEEAEPEEVFVAVGTTLTARRDSLDNLRLLLVVGLTAALVVSSAAAYLVTSASLRPVEAMRRRASSISGRLRGERLPTTGSGDEIGRLGDTLNELLGRVEDASARERSFLADASHELRTPLSTLRAELDLADREATTDAELRESVHHARGEAERLASLAEGLLTLARADAGELVGEPEPVPMAAVARTVADRAVIGGIAPEAGIEVVVPEDLRGHADPRLVEIALGAMVDNACRHGAAPISIRGREDDGSAVIRVADRGPGFPEDFLPHAFERFARADRTRSTPGTGLGLAIVAAVAAASGGGARAGNDPVGGGVVDLTLPMEPPA